MVGVVQGDRFYLLCYRDWDIHISYESTHNNQNSGIEMTSTKEREKSYE